MKKILIMMFIMSLIFGCQTRRKEEIINTHTNIEKPKFRIDKKVFKKEAFIFKEDSYLKMDYSNFCTTTKQYFCKSLEYSKYVNRKGYFLPEAPTTSRLGKRYYPVMLDNGEKFFFVMGENYSQKFTLTSQIIKYEQVPEFKRVAIVENSDIYLNDGWVYYDQKNYALSNGKYITGKKLSLIREVSKRYKKRSVEIAKLLLDFKINKDEVDYKYFIKPSSEFLRGGVALYIGFNKKKTWLRFEAQYHDYDWLFVKSFKVAADDFRWQSPKYKFKRDNSSNGVWEWADIPATKKIIAISKKIASAKKVTIRFQGTEFYSDKLIENEQKNDLLQIIKLFQLMKT